MKKHEQIKQDIEAYFASRKTPLCAKDGTPILDEDGRMIYEITRPLTVSGLARSLGFSSREKMLSIKDKKSAEAIASALLAIEEYAEEKLFYKESFAGTKLFLSVNFPRWNATGCEEGAEPFPESFENWAR